MTTRTFTRLLVLALIAMLCIGLAVDRYRTITAMRLHGLLLFGGPLLAGGGVLLLCRRDRPDPAAPRTALLLLALLALLTQGLFDAGRHEPNISRRLVPLLLPLLAILVGSWYAACRRAGGWRARLAALVLSGCVLWSLFPTLPFLSYSNYASLNPPLAQVAAALPPQAILIIDWPRGLLDTPLHFHHGIATVNGDGLTAAELAVLRAQAAARHRPLFLLRSRITPTSGWLGEVSTLLAANSLPPPLLADLPLVWEDTTDGVRHPRRTAPLRVLLSLQELPPPVTP